ncbi:hypothetical protein PF010_g10397 [Phytophthora fragariae]|nr:hypothetical protein PF009_g19181 [Phytophthora fragariae]KAE8994111.1 hypothetical protein PF011_g16852 [Phytophthora fragariae]KAE9094173.1 hypothetical protein PF007_g17851 [Phytophthora fragariae]KAE9112573.1 hypothetical protein PF010_g10397 [Phytophthora fragariae]KAE9125118.1 hypothetical protein PF006_g17030 [Phytophthora fragariae]
MRRDNPDINCPVRLMGLFAAIKDGHWLADNDDIALQLGRGERTDEVNEMTSREDRELSPVQSIKYWLNALGMTGERAPAEAQIHVLVTVPTYQIYDRQVVAVDYGARWRARTSIAPSSEFKANLAKTYHCDMGGGRLRCMLLNAVFPSKLVAAFHLFFRNKPEIIKKIMGFDDVDDVRNGLLLFKPLMYVFDRNRVSFIYYKDSDQFRLKVLDKSLLGERLFEKLSSKQREILLGRNKLPQNWEDGGEWVVPGTGFSIQTTFGDVDGQALLFGPTLQRPYRRCLCLQAVAARKVAVEVEWSQPDEDKFEDFREEGMSLTEKMRVFHASQS